MLQAYAYGVGSVIGAKFREDALYVTLDRFFRDRQLIGDELVAIPSCSQGQNFAAGYCRSTGGGPLSRFHSKLTFTSTYALVHGLVFTVEGHGSSDAA
jgi:hypothetical protein